MPQNSPASLWDALRKADDLSARFLFGAEASVPLSELLGGSALDARGDELRGRSVLVATVSQLIAAAVLIELDGLARRVVLYPGDLPLEHLPFVMDTAAVDAIVSDRTTENDHPAECFIECSGTIGPGACDREKRLETEWILLTSGTTGRPKLVVHTLASLTGALAPGGATSGQIVWSTFYDIRRYGGLQIFLRAILTGTSLVLSSAEEATADFLARAGAHGVTHISGTPSQWRRALMSPAADLIAPEYVRLSGEIADQAILNQLRAQYPSARIAHAFASTEAGVAFVVGDGRTGFPASVVADTAEVEMKVVHDSLRIRSDRTAARYLGDPVPILRDAEGFVDTGDMLELRDGRYYFAGRRDGVINVGGLKVYPEEVEAVINRHPEVQMSLVRRKKSPIMGALVVADVVLKTANCHDARQLQHDILGFCRESLSAYKVPVAIRFVPALAVAETGKLVRPNA
jgi:acyl-coenzyme A synthetase/AMP-(fatty) acid ligase